MQRAWFTGVWFTSLLACQPGDAEPRGRAAAPALRVVSQTRPIAPSARLTVDPGRHLHAASPFVLGYNRNHSHRQFAVHGFSREAFLTALRALSPRWGEAYLRALQQAGYPAHMDRRASYRTGHAPTDGRFDYSYLGGFRFQACWGQDGQAHTWDGYPYDDFRYPLAEADEAGAEPLVTVNFGTDSAASAGALAGWLNAATHPLRDTHPFHVPAGQGQAPRGAYMFELGNEVQLAVERGHEKALTIPMYVREARPYEAALRAASPHPIKVALAAAVNTYWGGPSNPARGEHWPQQEAMVEAFLAAARTEGLRLDALQFHGYPSYPVREKLAGNAYVERLITTRLAPALSRAPHPVEIWNDEFHAASGLPRNTGIYGALYAADAAVTAFRLTDRGRQLIPVTTDFAAWHAGRGGASDSLYFPDHQVQRPSPLYRFRSRLAASWGDWILPTEVRGIPSWVDVGHNGEQTPVAYLSATAARDPAGRTHVLVVNRSREACEAAVVTPQGAALGSHGHRWTLAPSGHEADPWDTPWDRVTEAESPIRPDARPVHFPAASITLLTYTAR